jgi:hypothetical protein
VRAFEAARMLTNFDPANPDYNIPYYCDKLLKLHKKFEEFLPAEDGSNQGELF